MKRSVTSKSSLPTSDVLPVLVRRELEDDATRTTLACPLPVRRTLLCVSAVDGAGWSTVPPLDFSAVSLARIDDGWDGFEVCVNCVLCGCESSTSLHSTFGMSGLLKLTCRIVSRFVFFDTWCTSVSATDFFDVWWESVSESSASFRLLWLPYRLLVRLYKNGLFLHRESYAKIEPTLSPIMQTYNTMSKENNLSESGRDQWDYFQAACVHLSYLSIEANSFFTTKEFIEGRIAFCNNLRHSVEIVWWSSHKQGDGSQWQCICCDYLTLNGWRFWVKTKRIEAEKTTNFTSHPAEFHISRRFFCFETVRNTNLVSKFRASAHTAGHATSRTAMCPIMAG